MSCEWKLTTQQYRARINMIWHCSDNNQPMPYSESRAVEFPFKEHEVDLSGAPWKSCFIPNTQTIMCKNRRAILKIRYFIINSTLPFDNSTHLIVVCNGSINSRYHLLIICTVWVVIFTLPYVFWVLFRWQALATAVLVHR